MAAITLLNFEKKVPAQVLNRGRKLWEKGMVRNLSEQPVGDWFANVEGSTGYDYDVTLSLEQNGLTYHECDCPYNLGMCKHQVAVLYAIQEELSKSVRPTKELVLPLRPLSKTEIMANARAGRRASDHPPIQQLSRSAILAKAREARLARVGKTLHTTQNVKAVAPPAQKIAPTPDRSVGELFDAYGKLEEAEKHCVKIAAAAWEAMSATKFVEIFNSCGFKYKGLNLYVRDLTTILPKLTSAGFLIPVEFQFRCNRSFAQALCDMQFATDPDLSIIAGKLRQLMPISWYAYGAAPDRVFREMRLARYLNLPGEFQKYFNDLINKKDSEYTLRTTLDFWLLTEPNPDYMDNLPPDILGFLLMEKLNIKIFFLEAADVYDQYVLKKLPDFAAAIREALGWQMGQLLLFRGEWDDLIGLFDTITPEKKYAFAGILKLIACDTEASSELFANARKELRRESRSSKNELRDLAGVFQIMAALKSLNVGNYSKIKSQLDHVYKHGSYYVSAFDQLQAVILFLQNDRKAALQMVQAKFVYDFPVMYFFQYLCLYWIDEKLIDLAKLDAFHENLKKNGYAWLAAEMLALRAFLKPEDEVLFAESQQQSGELGAGALAGLLPRVEPWEQALNIMSGIAADDVESLEKGTRLIWIVDFELNILTPKEQTFGKKGWTSGRMIPDYQLLNANLSCMTEQDKRIARTFTHGGYYYGQHHLSTWQALVGHPLLFSAKSQDIIVQLTEEQPVLVAQKQGDGFEIRFSHKFTSEGFQIIKESPTRYKLLVITADQAQIAKSFNGESLFVPENAADRLNQIMSGLGQRIPVRSAFEEENLPLLPADARVCVHLLPVGDGFYVEIYSKPFMSTLPYFKPGEGEASATAMVGGERVRTLRDLKAETGNVAKLLDQADMLRQTTPVEGVWELQNAGNCLELLTQLYPLVENGQILLEWPKGEKMRVMGEAGFDRFKMSIRGENDWFEVTGEINVDENHVLTMQQLLAWSASSEQFVEISPGKFLALTKEFRRRLRQINGLLTTRKNGTLQLHPLAAGAFETFTELVKDLDFDRKFQENRERLRDAFEGKYKIPKNFNAALRPYQQEGFVWMSRCAAAGLGACLADDMGLGKTIQALALLTTRAKSGPALVVAPASVCRNWVAETQKFAPALRPILFGEGDRSSIIEKAGKGDLIIITYDLMARSSGQLSKKQFSTIVLDEAQSIKNRQSKRSETAMQLNCDFRLIMTGTPVENHLGELWNLFQFTNPGLLGSIEHFNQQFAVPIEKYGDKDRREQLRRLIQPFILRRRKEEVLRELPAKTEITLLVALSPQERVFYEALRRNALDKLSADTESGAGEKHLRILAEIMRLRRAACHPNLADAAAGFTSSAKLELFGEILNELLDNGHKALVFSQFVGHLKILEAYVKNKNIPYQYLDGQTPASLRQKRIDAFQSGEGDLFLISLKAGGTGLNLTAADYVIHTDPWWNPAVEDQASDRAHRIGQVKPVTVYRLVAEHTIEEKILQLHAEKRDLADSLLAGTNISARLTAEDLLQLMNDGRLQ